MGRPRSETAKPSLDRAGWVALGKVALAEMLDQHYAAPWVEIEARLSAKRWRDNSYTIDPHILTIAKGELLSDGQIVQLHAPTRGGGEVAVFHLPVVRGRSRLITDTAARKRLLVARWKSWARGSAHMPNLIGEGGEAVVHESLLAAGPYGYRVIQPTRGEITSLFGGVVPGGPLDNGAWLSTIDARTQAPATQYLVPIEVKNLRHWLYPTHWEPFQLLHKAAGLANAHPEFPVLPILICRKAHYRTLEMARDLGFLIFQTHDQYVLPSERIELELFDAVRNELSFDDLVISSSRNDNLVTWLSGAVLREARKFASRWAEFGRHHVELYRQLRDDEAHWSTRTTWLESLHKAAREMLPHVGNWASSDDE